MRQGEREGLEAALRQSEARHRAILESIDHGFCLLQVLFDEQDRPTDYRFLETNAAFEEHTGLRDAAGRTARELVPDLDESWFQLYGKVALTGEQARVENHAPAMDRWFEVSASRVGSPELRQVALVFKNITQRRADQQQRERLLGEVEAARRRLHSLFENAPVFVCSLRGPRHVFELVNPAYQRMVGTGRPLLGLPAEEALPEIVAQGFVGVLDGLYRSGEPLVSGETQVRFDRRGDGRLEEVFITFVYQPARDPQGQVEGIDVFGFEVTDQVWARRRVEALAGQLRESEERVRRVVEASGTGTWELDAASGELVTDARFRELFGRSAEDPLTLEQALCRVHPGDRARISLALADAMAGQEGGRIHHEFRTVRFPDGPPQWVEARGHGRRGPGGGGVRILGTAIDITARKEAEAAQASLLSALADQPLLYVALFRGPELVFETANALYREVVGGREVVGKPLHEAVPELRGQGFDTLLTRVMQTGEPFIGREVHVRLDRRGRGIEDAFFNFVYQAVRGGSGEIERVLVIGHDVTDEVLARKEAQRADKERSEFEQQLIGIVSHDLRSPIGAITLSAELLLRSPELGERQRKPLGRILSSAERAHRLIRDLLDFTQARFGGGLPVHRERVDLHAAVRQVVDEIQISNPERALQVEARGDAEGLWDGDRMAQVLGNLLTNALQYSPADTPVSVKTAGHADQVVLEVHNGGAAIPKDVLPRLFQPMQRGSGAGGSSRSVGLGLYIVGELVSAHGGTIEVESAEGEGTTFTVRLPRSPGQAPGLGAEPAPAP